MFASRGKRMELRTNLEVVLVFMVFPVPVGMVILAMTGLNALAHGHLFTASDWLFQVVWCGLLGLGILLALPAVGIEELRKRSRARVGDPRDTQPFHVTPSIAEPHQQANTMTAPKDAVAYPRYVHLLAQVYVVSLLAGCIGFLVFSAAAGFLFLLRGFVFDGYVLGMLTAALACPLSGTAFRGWFVRWGQRRWPSAESPKETRNPEKKAP